MVVKDKFGIGSEAAALKWACMRLASYNPIRATEKYRS